MSRIYVSLAILAVCMMFGALGLGLSLGDLKGELDRAKELKQAQKQLAKISSPSAEETQSLETVRGELQSIETIKRRTSLHRLIGLGAAINVMLVNCIAVTYFVGTTRWCREVVEAYSLDLSLHARGMAMKRRAFFWAIIGMLAMLAISALGAAGDPMSGSPTSTTWVTPHLIAALVGTGVAIWSFFSQWVHITEQHEIIGQVVQEVAIIRKERGLDQPSGTVS